MYVSLCLCISVSLLCNNDSNVHQVSVFLCVCDNESVRLLDVCVSVSMCVHACVRACDLTVTNDPNICLMKQYFCIADFYTIMEQVQEGTGMSF